MSRRLPRVSFLYGEIHRRARDAREGFLNIGTWFGRRLTVGRSSVQSARSVLSADLGHRRTIKRMTGMAQLSRDVPVFGMRTDAPLRSLPKAVAGSRWRGKLSFVPRPPVREVCYS